MKNKVFILGSSSASRIELLKKIHFEPNIIISPDIDETPLKKETPRILAARLAEEKNKKIQSELKENLHLITADQKYQELILNNKFAILTADTVCVKGRRILDKTSDKNKIREYLNLLSSGNHRVYTALCIFDGEQNKAISKISESRIKFKRLTEEEINFYLLTKEGEGKAGGYAISGYAARFIEKIVGNPSCISGLDLRIACNLINSCGFNLMDTSKLI